MAKIQLFIPKKQYFLIFFEKLKRSKNQFFLDLSLQPKFLPGNFHQDLSKTVGGVEVQNCSRTVFSFRAASVGSCSVRSVGEKKGNFAALQAFIPSPFRINLILPDEPIPQPHKS